MSDEVAEDKTTDEALKANNAEKLAKTFRLIDGEEILLTKSQVFLHSSVCIS